jgi:diguanylate cyclase (GGDEF)-like protein
VEATRRLSTGSDAFVARGGIKELDVLAVAFNDMAQQLAAARDSADANQARLEDKVLERTNALRHLAEHDPLTQLPNRRHLLARLSSALTDATNSGHRVGVYFLDLDNFKYVNDSMGHGFGDLVLQSVARRLRDISSSFGFAARLGGDEFTLVYLSASTTIAIAEVGAAICRAFHDPLLVGERQIKMSVSVGISVYPDHERNVDALLRAADAALFRAKALGRSQLSVFSADLLEAAVARFSTEQGLRRAVEHGEFELAFQAEVSLASRTPTLVEALLRWRTPAGDLLAPGEFLSVAEESGLVLDISDWVLRTAVETAAGWHFGEWPGVRIAINVSTRQLLDTQFVDRLCGLLRQHRLPPACIELELTENVLQTGPATIEVLRQLRAYGVAIALDDFGTGYSSLSSLELLPLTRVKLDRSLIASIDTSSVSLAIARAIIGLCRNLDLEVTAEGVERPEQLAILSGNRAMHVQGYLLSRPVPGDRLIAELQALPSRVRSLLGTHALVGASALERANATDDLRVRAARG